MATAAAALRMAVPAARRNTFFTGTPEIYFAKAIDNSRLVKVEDPGRNREMKQFGTALACLFLLVFTYACSISGRLNMDIRSSRPSAN